MPFLELHVRSLVISGWPTFPRFLAQKRLPLVGFAEKVCCDSGSSQALFSQISFAGVTIAILNSLPDKRQVPRGAPVLAAEVGSEAAFADGWRRCCHLSGAGAVAAVQHAQTERSFRAVAEAWWVRIGFCRGLQQI
ncbi:hypothetical protein NDU88_002277 [Pleurodeles waltl]|uniref:Uncharacterized protein n=1 Tax=Pleurodeles waltl TaxID=8319 RepID=A0AAV7TLI2_PLEWA|nr:hypothetical protein NDU88_002277 [Pleurodeles waltl]